MRCPCTVRSASDGSMGTPPSSYAGPVMEANMTSFCPKKQPLEKAAKKAKSSVWVKKVAAFAFRSKVATFANACKLFPSVIGEMSDITEMYLLRLKSTTLLLKSTTPRHATWRHGSGDNDDWRGCDSRQGIKEATSRRTARRLPRRPTRQHLVGPGNTLWRPHRRQYLATTDGFFDT